MQKYFNSIASSSGQPIYGASVQVNLLSGLPATIYSDNGLTVRSNPILTDLQGYFEFYADDGHYSLVISGPGISTLTIADILLEDPASAQFTSGTMTGVTINNSVIGNATPAPATFTTLTATGFATFADTISTGRGVTTGDAAIEVGALRTGNGPAYVDLHGGVTTDFEARFIRLGGADGAASLINTGLGAFNIQQAAAAPIVFQTSSTERMRIGTSGRLEINADANGQCIVAKARAANDVSQIVFTDKDLAGGRGWITVDNNNAFTFATNGSAQNQFAIVNTAGSIRTVNVTGATGSGNPKVYPSAGSIVIGSGAALATTATDGYMMIPSCAGAPTGVPANSGGGQVPLHYDTTNNRLYAYNGAWRSVAVA